MLTNFNNLLKSALWQEIQNNDDEEQKTDPGWLRSICDSNMFFYKYLKEQSEKNNVIPMKQMENMFAFFGNLDDIVKFLRSFKVDKDFMENPEEFLVFAPSFNLGDQNPPMSRDERYAPYTYDENSEHYIENLFNEKFDGTWIDLYKGEGPTRVRIGKIKPNDLATELKKAVDLLLPGHKKNVPVLLKVEINCRGLVNAVWDELSDYVDIFGGDFEKKLHEKDDYEFDYNQLNTKEKTSFEGAEDSIKMAKKEKK